MTITMRLTQSLLTILTILRSRVFKHPVYFNVDFNHNVNMHRLPVQKHIVQTVCHVFSYFSILFSIVSYLKQQLWVLLILEHASA